MSSSAQLAKETEEALKRVMKRANRSKKTARAFLVRAGLLTKNGKPTNIDILANFDDIFGTGGT